MGKTPFLSPFLHFFRQIELFCRKTVRINRFPEGIQNLAKIGKKKVNRQTPDKKNHRQKKLTNTGYFAEKNHGCTIISHRATFVYFWWFFLPPHGTQMTLKTKKYFFLHSVWIKLTSSKNISKILVKFFEF